MYNQFIFHIMGDFKKALREGVLKVAVDYDGLIYGTGYGGLGTTIVSKLPPASLEIAVELIEQGNLVEKGSPFYTIEVGKKLQYYEWSESVT